MYTEADVSCTSHTHTHRYLRGKHIKKLSPLSTFSFLRRWMIFVLCSFLLSASFSFTSLQQWWDVIKLCISYCWDRNQLLCKCRVTLVAVFLYIKVQDRLVDCRKHLVDERICLTKCKIRHVGLGRSRKEMIYYRMGDSTF